MLRISFRLEAFHSTSAWERESGFGETKRQAGVGPHRVGILGEDFLPCGGLLPHEAFWGHKEQPPAPPAAKSDTRSMLNACLAKE